jgi:polysaccharide export outer membrane protein
MFRPTNIYFIEYFPDLQSGTGENFGRFDERCKGEPTAMKRGSAILMLCLSVAAGLPAAAQSEEATEARRDAYVIGVEDELRIVVWGEKDLSIPVKVRPDGKITVPLVNDILVLGLTTDEVRAKITGALGEYIREPNVTVIVDSILSYRIFFLGEVKRQGALNFYQPTRLLQGIAAASGATEFADKVIVLRETPTGETRSEFDYKKLLSGTHENIVLLPGDTVIVKQ